ncbi:MAG: competence/damage-inducible protein A [Chlorobiota bacterium]
MIKAKIISIGDELLIGNTINTNSAWISKQLTELGITVTSSVMIPDDENRIINSLKNSNEEIIITTGGLGPTKDDITKRILCKYFDSKLIYDEAQLERIRNYFDKKNREFKDVHKDQALRPDVSLSLNNNVGTAPGIYTEYSNRIFFTLPGVPSEMKDIFSNQMNNLIKKFIENNSNDFYIYETIYTTGLPESELFEKIEDLDDDYEDVKFAYLPSASGVKIRLGILNSTISNKPALFEEVKDKIIEEIGNFIIEEQSDLIEATISLLKQKNLTISVAESCTGGGLGKAFTDLPGSSDYFEGGIISYSNNAKVKLLNVNKHILEKYGAVSKQTAEEMAVNCREIFDTDYSISITGIAGPDGGSEEKPVGTIYVCIYNGEVTEVKNLNLSSTNRDSNREKTIEYSISMLYRILKNKYK